MGYEYLASGDMTREDEGDGGGGGEGAGDDGGGFIIVRYTAGARDRRETWPTQTRGED
jgi:hypothetical protein